jgi:hypothetical protein
MCEYTAREVQGYIATGSWLIYVTPAGHPIEEEDPGYPAVIYSSDMGSPSCLADVIQAGDHVQVWVYDEKGSRVHTGAEVSCPPGV